MHYIYIHIKKLINTYTTMSYTDKAATSYI